MMQADAWEANLQRQREQIAADEVARTKNIQRLVEAFLTIGGDCAKLDTSNFDAQILEAKGIAASRWLKLHDAELQLKRETEALRVRPRQRPAQAQDRLLGSEGLAVLQSDWERDTETLRVGLRQLRETAEHDRKELESYTAKPRR